MNETTEDAFLNGLLTIHQLRSGYRAGADPVLLAAAVEAKAGDRVLDVGCGVGVALYCLMHRVQGVEGFGLERQLDLAKLASKNAEQNGFAAQIVKADLFDLPSDLKEQSFTHVLTNPPFFDRGHGSASQNDSREAGRGETVSLETWIDACVRRLAPGGRLWMIQRAVRLPDILSALDGRVGDIRVRPLSARVGRMPETVIVAAKKGAKAPFQLLSNMVMHAGSTHQDGDHHTPLFRSVLREGAALPMVDSA